MSSRICLFALIAVSAMHFVSGELDGRIVGGSPTSIKMIPYQASVQYVEAKKSQHFCGGSIISEKFIVTAGHCTEYLKPRDLRVSVGTDFKNHGGIKKNVLRIIRHQNYSSESLDNDIALLELSTRLKFSILIQPIALPIANESIADNSTCLVSGWGDRTPPSIESRNGKTKLRAVEVPIVNQSKCNDDYKMFGGITPRMLCAGYDIGKKDACAGDSGGPLVCAGQNGTLKQFGIVSWGYECAAAHYPGVYSRVVSLREWIQEKTGI